MPYCIPKPGDCQEWFRGADDKAPHTLDWVLSASSKDLEWDGEWVQWAFPLDECSQFNMLAPVLTEEEIVAMVADREVSVMLTALTYKFLTFLMEERDWTHRLEPVHNHNRKRITRAIKSLMLLGREDLAHNLLKYVKEQTKNSPELVFGTWCWWNDAVKVKVF